MSRPRRATHKPLPKRKEPRTRGGLRLALTIAGRTSIRSLGRSALIISLVALPIAGLAGIATVYQSTQPTTEDRIRTQLGQMEAMLLPGDGWPVTQNPTNAQDAQPSRQSMHVDDFEMRSPDEVLPDGTRILSLAWAEVTATTDTGVGLFQVTEGPSWDDAFSGMFDIAEGRAPRNDREVMVTASLLPRLGVQVGDTVELRSPSPLSVTIVGILDAQHLPDEVQRFFARDGALSGATAEERLSRSEFYLPDTELDWPAVQKLNEAGITALSRAVLLDPPPNSGGYESWQVNNFLAIFPYVAIGGAFAAFEVILLAGAAFTVTARQQQRTLATIASVGAPRRLLFRILSANGIVLGAIGGVIGAAVGVGAGAAFMQFTANGSSTQYYGLHVPWLALVGCVAFAVVIGWIASLLPARSASRFDIVSALRGARKPPAASRRRPVVGLAMLLAGLAMTLIGGVLMAVVIDAGRGMPGGHPLTWVPIAMLIIGPVLAQLGLVLCGPLVLRGIASALQKAGIGARLASRDAARNPGRAVPALAAIMTTIFVAVFAMCMISSGQESSIRNHQYQQAYGQVAVPLTEIEQDLNTGAESRVPYEHVDAIEDALHDSLDVGELRVLSGVPDPAYSGMTDDADESAAPDETAVAMPMVAPENLCPSSPRSPEYDEEASMSNSPEHLAAMDNDPRCNQYYLMMTNAIGAHLYVGDSDDLALVLEREPSAEARETLASGGAVALYSAYVHDGEFSVAWWDPEQASMATYGGQTKDPIRTVALDAVVDLPENPIHFGVFVSPETADGVGLEYRDIKVLASTTTVPTTAETDALNQAMQSLPDNGFGRIYAHVETGPAHFAGPILWGLLGLAAVIAIASAGVAIGLARFDGRQDEATLASIGAQPLLRRNFAFWQAVVIAGVGALLGALMGTVPALALSANDDTPFAAPWLQIGVTVVVLPLVIACGSWLFTRRSTVSARRMTIA